MKQISLLTIFLVTITIGCRPLKNLSPTTYSIEPIKKSEFAKLNGRYNDIQDTVFGKIRHHPEGGIDENNRRLLDRLFIYYHGQANEKGTIVEIKFTSDKRATVNAFQNGTILFTKNIHGKFKNGYFYVRPKIFIIPFFPILYWHNFERVRIGKIGDNIIVDHTLKSWGLALVGGGSDNGLSTSIYRPTKE